ncbi:histidine kinase [Streptomyces sp. HNM0574]|uniref:sensor histidine kinase n=1 Tax=Streptomyces sp. HNM0574 TaxID=2714954 RepID=UPI00146A44F0|nr:histidine kinase [Streptomyces sp. HNM0574]NLU70545.1 histidine kinase [Streptomyces sp. HNM0574]
MKRTGERLLPILLLGVQAMVWPGTALLSGALPTVGQLLGAALADGLVAAALTARRTRPVPVLVLAAAVCAMGAAALPTGAVAVLGTAGVALALHTVAADRDAPTALLSVGTLALWQLVHGLSLHGLGDPQGLDLVLTALLYATATGTGRYARRRSAARRAAEERVRRAEAERRRLPAAERRRMERELHDVSAHHLTAVVVTVEAALGLRERRPELADEALRFAARTGREVTRALGAVKAPAPSADDLPSTGERLRELVTGFRALGQPLTCAWGDTDDPSGLPEGAVGDAVFGIVREALTNAVRHAPGAATTVRCTYEDARTEVVVTNAAPETGGRRPEGLGGGRGRTLLRERAREAGGTLTSGPTPDGGWEVRAVLPGRAGGTPTEVRAGRGHRLAQGVAAAGLCFQPLLPLLVIRSETVPAGPGVSAGALFTLLATAQTLTLLWLRRAPRTAPAVLLTLAALWPLAMPAGGYTGPALLPSALSLLITCVAFALRTAAPRGEAGADGQVTVRARAFGRRRPRAGDASPAARPHVAVMGAAAVAVHAVTLTVSLLARGESARGPAGMPGWGLAAVATAVAALAVGVAGLSGARHRARREAGRAAHHHRLASWTGEAVRDAWAERRRITTGLETTVLARTARVVEEAEAGHLARTAAEARSALTAMRALLDTVREAGEPEASAGSGSGELGETQPETAPEPARSPQPTLHALDLLAHQCRATGRRVRLSVSDRVPEELPTAVDLAAYRAAETVLEAGDDGAVLEFDATDGTLTLTATDVPRATGSTAPERLSARATALGGTLTTHRPATLHLTLPLTAAPAAP